MLRMAETDPVQDVLMQLDYRYEPELAKTLECVLRIAARSTRVNEDSRYFVANHLFAFPKSMLMPLLNRMIELGRIKALDVEAFADLLIYFGFSCAVLKHTELEIPPERWRCILGLAFSLLDVTPSEEPQSAVGD
jgi:hypothetical protein